MKLMLDRFYAFLNRPLIPWTRILLASLVIPLVLAFTQPLWRISMTAPQYPGGLSMDIFAYKLEGGNKGQHIAEINTLNHYIGMKKLDTAAWADLDWIPFALGAMALMALRVAVIGNVRHLVDLVVVTGYISVFSFGRFIYRLWVFGHDLDPRAPVKIEPFMPVILGHKQIANFHTYSEPGLGSYFMGVFTIGSVALLLVHLIRGRRTALRDEAAGKAPRTSVS